MQINRLFISVLLLLVIELPLVATTFVSAKFELNSQIYKSFARLDELEAHLNATTQAAAEVAAGRETKQKPEPIFKIFILGNAGVGKTWIFAMFLGPRAGELVSRDHRYALVHATLSNQRRVKLIIFCAPGLLDTDEKKAARNQKALDAALSLLPSSPLLLFFVLDGASGYGSQIDTRTAAREIAAINAVFSVLGDNIDPEPFLTFILNNVDVDVKVNKGERRMFKDTFSRYFAERIDNERIHTPIIKENLLLVPKVKHSSAGNPQVRSLRNGLVSRIGRQVEGSSEIGGHANFVLGKVAGAVLKLKYDAFTGVVSEAKHADSDDGGDL